MDQPVWLLMVGGHVQCRHDPVGGDFGELQADRSIEAVAEILIEFGWLLCCDRATLDGIRRLPGDSPVLFGPAAFETECGRRQGFQTCNANLIAAAVTDAVVPLCDLFEGSIYGYDG